MMLSLFMAEEKRLSRGGDINTSTSQMERFSRNYPQGYTTIDSISSRGRDLFFWSKKLSLLY